MNKYKYIFKFKDNKIILNNENKTIKEELKDNKKYIKNLKENNEKHIKYLKENEHILNYIWKY